MLIEERHGVSEAEDLLDIGNAILHNKKCGCDECKGNLLELENTIRNWVRELAVAWANASDGLHFTGLVEEWDDKRIAQEMNFTIPKGE